MGFALVTIDAIFYSALRLRYHSIWASVWAHGLVNTVGLAAFFLVGPLHGLW